MDLMPEPRRAAAASAPPVASDAGENTDGAGGAEVSTTAATLARADSCAISVAEAEEEAGDPCERRTGCDSSWMESCRGAAPSELLQSCSGVLAPLLAAADTGWRGEARRVRTAAAAGSRTPPRAC